MQLPHETPDPDRSLLDRVISSSTKLASAVECGHDVRLRRQCKEGLRSQRARIFWKVLESISGVVSLLRKGTFILHQLMRISGRVDGLMDGWMDGWTDGRTDGWMDPWMDPWMDGQMDR